MSQQDFLLQKAAQNLDAAELLLQKGFADIAASRSYAEKYLGKQATG